MTHAERIHLAQELHDGIAQELVGIGYSLDLLLASPQMPPQARVDLRTLRFGVGDLIDRVRREMHELRNDSDADLWLSIQESALSLCANSAVEFKESDVRISPPGEFAYQFLQIARELLRNSARHSAAENLVVALSLSDGYLTLIIEDDGVGGVAEDPLRFGIVSAQTRAKNLGGFLQFESSEPGTKAVLRVPY